ncbi:MAG: hypothetical protein QOI10_2147 [Solirubrobacterales bacterium]|jgi:uncharacterized protein YbcI|nr:hypothetical protein [Solirubrobacterales bacterium]
MAVRPVGGELLAKISNAMVALHREHFGRGPGAAKCVIADEIVVCTLSDVFTHVERTLIEAGAGERVRDARQMHQRALEPAFRQTVEELTGRGVVAFLSSVHFDPDLAVEVFVLEPLEPAAAVV